MLNLTTSRGNLSSYLDGFAELALLQMHRGDVIINLCPRVGHRLPLVDGLVEVAGEGRLHAIVPVNNSLLQRHLNNKLVCGLLKCLHTTT